MGPKKRKVEQEEEEQEETVRTLREMFPSAPLGVIEEKLSRGLCFDAVVDHLIGKNFDHDASVLIISDSETESSPLPTPRQKKTRTGGSPAGREELTDRQARCYREMQEVVGLPSEQAAAGSSRPPPNLSPLVLRRVAVSLPSTLKELLAVRGVTQAWGRRFGELVLGVTRDYRGREEEDRQDETPALDEEEEDVADISLNLTVSSNERVVEEEVDPETAAQVDSNLSTLSSILPAVDPDFLLTKAREIGGDNALLQAFISQSLEGKASLPSRKEQDKRVARRKDEMAIRKLRPTDFLEMGDPHSHFEQTSGAVGEQYRQLALYYLSKHFPTHTRAQVDKVLARNNSHFVPSIKEIKELAPPKKGKQVVSAKDRPKKPEEMDLVFLKEYVYYKLEARIRKHQEKLEATRLRDVKNAKKTGALFECQVCYDGDCLLRDVAMCEAGCLLCRDCVKRGAGVAIGDGKSDIECLAGCGASMGDEVLRAALPARILERLLQRRQMVEVEAAGLQDLERCPACSFATIMPDPGEKILQCGNPECGKQTCRACKEDSHVPLTCDEVEKDSEVRARTILENVATEAMVRQCPKCNNRFFKEDGCNKMKCSCGQSMCYLCRAAVPDSYSHFYGQGGEPIPGKCPLWSDNKNLHRDEVVRAVEAEKKKIDPKDLKNDPTKNMEKPPPGFDRNHMREDMIQDEDDEDEEDEDEDDFLDDEDDFLEDSDDDEDGYRVQDWGF